ncbi:hypothetical protein K435DRAFT_838205 [Dendrothele bispora CBS 962.96]|uniref:FAD-binding FR-type domain-containing protein n=1 Tax=Dendrothele bispora (strain CBS 962.96) TaxID=1314807 RepID=A0A4S8M7H3_DENBC|nr:hypothetical protein K435DRAFT_838205 [Dendrothele bispora CBS 962.96]
MALRGWHIGERTIRRKLDFDKNPAISTLYTWISGDLDPDHAVFHSTCIPFLPVTTLDKEGRPWGSILTSPNGLPGRGFIRDERYTTLSVHAKLWEGEPFRENMKLFAGKEDEEDEEGKMLIAGIGIQFETRRRNKLAGWVSRLEQKEGDVVELELTVNQSLGNCPKYITTRNFIPHLDNTPRIKYQQLHMSLEDRLPDELISFIHQSDTVFFGTTYQAPPEEANLYPSHVGMNQRGGKKGFIRVSPTDGKTVVLPDYSGNRFLTSLGNVEASHLASFTFVSFTTGSVLYLTGEANNYVGADAKRIMPLHNGSLTSVTVTGYTFVQDALHLRLAPGSKENASPYSPPVTYLAEEPEMKNLKLSSGETRPAALLSRIDLHSANVATFTWEASDEAELDISPGEAIIMDFSTLLGQRQYRHMAQSNPKSINDDRIRTWTVSDFSGWGSMGQEGSSTSRRKTFSLTMREQPGGLVTGALFSIARRLAETKPDLLNDSSSLDIRVNIVGVSGGFGFPTLTNAGIDADGGDGDTSLSTSGLMEGQMENGKGIRNRNKTKTLKLLWVAGGIGVTPFLSMIRAPYTSIGGDSDSEYEVEWDVRLVLSANNPEVIVPLIRQAFEENEKRGNSLKEMRYGAEVVRRVKGLRLEVDVYSSGSSFGSLDHLSDTGANSTLKIRFHTGRVPPDFFSRSNLSSTGEGLTTRWDERDYVYLCGPKLFENGIVEDLVQAGVEVGKIKREAFAY